MVDAFGWGLDDLEWLTINGVKSAFAPFPERLRIINGVVKPRYALLPRRDRVRLVLGRRVTVEVTVVEHPLVADALARIRDRTTPNALFRQNLERIGTLLLARATESLPTVRDHGDHTAHGRPGEAAGGPTGRGADPACRARFRPRRPGAAARRRRRVRRDQPRRGDVRAQAVRQQAAGVARRAAGDRDRPDARDRRLAGPHVRAAPRARRAAADHRRVRALRAGGHRAPARRRLVGARGHGAIDEHLNDQAFIVPGLGDAGDRQFGPPA